MSVSVLRRLLLVLTALLALVALGPPALAQRGVLPTPTGPVQAGPSLVVDMHSGEVLHQRDASAPWYPASLTKMMTLYLLFEDLKAGRIRLTDQLAFSPYAYNQQPSKLVLPAGATISIEQAILALILRSANDVAVAVGERLAGSEPAFAQRMNATAKRLGMTGSNFRNPSGWKDPAQVTTARDMATLAMALIRDFPDRYAYFTQNEVIIRGARITHSVRFLEKYPGADGLKTGFLCSSGFNLVASATRDGRRLIGVALGFRRSDLRDEAMVRLFDEAFAKKSAGSGQKLFQLPASSGGQAPIVLDDFSCSPYRYDYPGNGAWVGTFLNLQQARAAHVAAQARLVELKQAWIGREWIVDVTANKSRRFATIIADLEPGVAEKLCADYQARRRFCLVKRPTELVRPFGGLWR
ncbi:MAG: D-alanyl-D-alanine carboxypeptidase [Alphaproteobacteria bacterium]|nr:D-alanyl-D-alanine carboxypeptidase [Alphaproteobacteria bacterium]MCW5740838.1 D-alanyl-D-alanine carboxypeptidase [Alphaproteobacteria bacterium]